MKAVQPMNNSEIHPFGSGLRLGPVKFNGS